VIRPAQMVVGTLVAQLRVLIKASDRYDKEIEAISKTLPDYWFFASFPGAGQIQAPRLVVAFGDDRDRFASASEVQRYAGIAPVVERSGNRCWIHWRIACSAFLRQTFVEWTGSTISRSS
jgi:transposase